MFKEPNCRRPSPLPLLFRLIGGQIRLLSFFFRRNKKCLTYSPAKAGGGEEEKEKGKKTFWASLFFSFRPRGNWVLEKKENCCGIFVNAKQRLFRWRGECRRRSDFSVEERGKRGMHACHSNFRHTGGGVIGVLEWAYRRSFFSDGSILSKEFQSRKNTSFPTPLVFPPSPSPLLTFTKRFFFRSNACGKGDVSFNVG